jgi:hypothetical protein
MQGKGTYLNLGIALYNYYAIIEKLHETYLAYACQFPESSSWPENIEKAWRRGCSHYKA